MKYELQRLTLLGCLLLLHPAGAFADRDEDTMIDANQLAMYVQNTGSFGRDRAPAQNAGLFYPKGTQNTVLYAGGLWLSGQVNNELRTTVAEFSYDFTPGQFKNNAFYDATIDSVYKVYKIQKGDSNSSNPDYANWPVSQGAPVDATGKPLLLGDQTLYTVYTDGIGPRTNKASTEQGLGIEVRHTAFAFDRVSFLARTIFMKYMLINRSDQHIQSAYVSFWTDPDLGGAGDDLIGCDAAANLVYCYNDTDSDPQYGNRPPALGFDLLQGTLADSTGSLVNLPDGRQLDNKKMLLMTSAPSYYKGVGVGSPSHAYSIMQGQSNQGGFSIDPTTGLPSLFAFTGDPITGKGWLDGPAGDRRFILNCGPFDLPPWQDVNSNQKPDLGEPGVQEVIMAIVVGHGLDRLDSIERLRENARLARLVYNANFDLNRVAMPTQPALSATPGNGKISLRWTNTPETTWNDPHFIFEGYNIYQITNQSDGSLARRKIATFDKINGITTIIEDGVTVQQGTDSGLRYEVELTRDLINNLPLYNSLPYSYAITSYVYNPNPQERPRTLESPLTDDAITIIPMDSDALSGQMLTATHANGQSEAALLVRIVDPAALTGDQYEVTFSPSPQDTANLVWHLKDLNRNTTVLADQPYFNLADFYFWPMADGFILNVNAPKPGVKSGDQYSNPNQPELWGWNVPHGQRRFTWVNAADVSLLPLEGFNGAIGWEDPCHFFGGCETQIIPVGRLKRTLLKLAQVPDGSIDWNPVFNENDENVSYAYRFGRNFSRTPAVPRFAPYILQAKAGLAYQDFTKSVPLSAWDMDANPPRRLALAFLENNATSGLVDGKWWPGNSNTYDNTASDGPREWLWILDADYSPTANPDYLGELITNQTIPIMYWLTVNRRGSAPFSPGGSGEDQFEIIPGRILTKNDVFIFDTAGLGIEDETEDTQQPTLFQNRPNPFSVSTTIRYRLPQQSHVRVAVYNVAGQLVRVLTKAQQNSGQYEANWDGRNEAGEAVSSGVYFYRLETPQANKTGKMVLLR